MYPLYVKGIQSEATCAQVLPPKTPVTLAVRWAWIKEEINKWEILNNWKILDKQKKKVNEGSLTWQAANLVVGVTCKGRVTEWRSVSTEGFPQSSFLPSSLYPSLPASSCALFCLGFILCGLEKCKARLFDCDLCVCIRLNKNNSYKSGLASSWSLIDDICV